MSTNLVGSVLLNICRVCTVSYIIHNAGFDNYGLYAFVLSTIAFTQIFILGGHEVSLTKSIAEYGSISFFYISLKKCTINCIIICFILIVTSYVMETYLKKANYFSAICIIIPSLFSEIFARLCISVSKGKFIMYFQYTLLILKELLVILLLFIFNYFSFKNHLFLCFTISSILTFFIALLFFKHLITNYNFDNKIYNYDSYLCSTRNLFLNEFTNKGINTVDILMLGFFSSNNFVAVYAVLLRVSSLLLLMQKSFRSILMPIYSKIINQADYSHLKLLWIKTSALIFLITLIVTLLVYYFSSIIFDFFNILHTNENIIIFTILLLSRLVFTFSGTSGSLLIVLNKSRAFFLSDMFCFVIFVISLSIYVPIYHIYAASYCFLLTMLIMSILRIILAYREVNKYLI